MTLTTPRDSHYPKHTTIPELSSRRTSADQSFVSSLPNGKIDALYVIIVIYPTRNNRSH